jgi:hypothetical protein
MYVKESHCENDEGMIVVKNHETSVHVNEGQKNYLDYFDVNF